MAFRWASGPGRERDRDRDGDTEREEHNTVFEEAADLGEAVRRELLDVVVVAVLGIIGADGDDLVVLLPLLQGSVLERRSRDRGRAGSPKNLEVLLATRDGAPGQSSA